MSTKLSDADVPLAVSLISPERLATFTAITGTERDALDLYQRSVSMSGALMSTVGMIEVALRNAICELLRQTFGKPDWLRNPPPPFRWKGEESSAIGTALSHARRAAYAKRSNTDKHALDAIAFPKGVPATVTHEERSKARQRAIDVTNGDHIAQLTLFFWKRLFSPDYDATLWKPALRSLFPDKTITRAVVATHIEALYVARNRLAHHEPLLGKRLGASLQAVDFVVAKFGPRTSDGAGTILEKLLAPHAKQLNEEAFALGKMLGTFQVMGTFHIPGSGPLPTS